MAVDIGTKEYYNLEVMYSFEDVDRYEYIDLILKEGIDRYIEYIRAGDFGYKPFANRTHKVVYPKSIKVFNILAGEFEELSDFNDYTERFEKEVNRLRSYGEPFNNGQIFRLLGKDITLSFNIDLEEILNTSNSNKKVSKSVSSAAKNTPPSPSTDDDGSEQVIPVNASDLENDTTIFKIQEEIKIDRSGNFVYGQELGAEIKDYNLFFLPKSVYGPIGQGNISADVLEILGIDKTEIDFQQSELEQKGYKWYRHQTSNNNFIDICFLSSKGKDDRPAPFDDYFNIALSDHKINIKTKKVFISFINSGNSNADYKTNIEYITGMIVDLMNDLPESKFRINLPINISEKQKKEYVEYLRYNLSLDIDEESENEIVGNKSKIATYLYDASKGEDYLGIDQDVTAFAKIMASQNLKPPLAIALFGKWGSGKSFFMNKLDEKIKRLSMQEKDNDNPDFCNGVAQIHFNAWSYLDANLWASIVCRIFEGLNEYISGNSKLDEYKKKIETQLKESLSIVKEKQSSLSKGKKIAEEKKIELEGSLSKLEEKLQQKLNEIKSKQFSEVIKKINDEFKAKEKITSALNENESLRQAKTDLKEYLPEEFREDPITAYNEIKSKSTFIKHFLNKKNIGRNLCWLLFILGLILIVPPFLKIVIKGIENINIVIPQLTVSGFAVVVPFYKRFKSTIKELQPLISSFWNLKREYEEKIQEVKNKSVQEEKALTLEIKKLNNEIAVSKERIQFTQEKIDDLDFKINNTLASHSLYNFIQEKSKAEEYKQHLGIVSIIRNDFEVLSNLFDESNEETEDFRKYFDKPLERIILYIDDLDRCSEDRVIEVLEAVNLLMAFPLFVVVVGVDPKWVNNALKQKYQHQFSGVEDKGKVNASDYLEKIFQIPFQLKEASDRDVKKMIEKLIPKKERKSSSSSPSKMEEMSRDEYLYGIKGDEDNFEEVEQEQEVNADFLDEILDYIPYSIEEVYLELSEREMELMQSFSSLIGNNPRTIKRFVNTYQIIRAHEGLQLNTNDQETDYLIIMLLISLSFGPYKDSCQELFINLNSSESQGLLKLFKPFDDHREKIFKIISNDSSLKGLLDLNIQELKSHYQLTKRFAFDCHSDNLMH